MGNANPIAGAAAGMGAKNSANNALDSAKEGLGALTAAPTDKQKAQAEKAKNRNTAFEQKKKEREERKKKLMAQMNAHKSG